MDSSSHRLIICCSAGNQCDRKLLCVLAGERGHCDVLPNSEHLEIPLPPLKTLDSKGRALKYSWLLRFDFIQQFLVCSETPVEIKAN